MKTGWTPPRLHTTAAGREWCPQPGLLSHAVRQVEDPPADKRLRRHSPLPVTCLTRPNGEPIDEHLRRFDDEGFVRAISHPFIEAAARQILRSERVFMTETVAQYRPAAGAPGDRLPVLRNQPWDPKEQWRWGCHIVSSPLPTQLPTPAGCMPHQSDQSGLRLRLQLQSDQM